MKEKLTDVIMRTYHDLTDLERETMIAYYKAHTLKECAAKWKIELGHGLPQFLTRGNPKMEHGGARKKTKIPTKSEYEKFKDELIERLGKDGKGLMLKFIQLYEANKTT